MLASLLLRRRIFFSIFMPLGNTRVVVDVNKNVVERYDYYPFGLVSRSSVSSDIETVQKFTGKELDDEHGVELYYFGARYHDPVTGRFVGVDPLAAKYPGWSPYTYTLNNPLIFVDPDGRDIGFYVNPDLAGGNGHTTLYFQDSKNNWYSFNQGANGRPSSGNLGLLSGSNTTAGVSINKVEHVPKGTLMMQTTSEQDELIHQSALKSQEAHNSGEKKYNLYSNNCTDAATDVVNNSGAGIQVENPGNIVKPNKWKQVLKDAKKEVKNVDNTETSSTAKADNTQVQLYEKEYYEKKQ